MRSVRASYVLALVAPVVAACLDFGELSGSSSDAGSFTNDASADGNGADATTDGATSDAGPDADAAHFCDQHLDATFCADFDEGDDASAGFTGDSVTDGGLLSVDDLLFQSPPASLLAGNTAIAVGDSAYGSVTIYTNVTPVTTATLDLDFRPDALPSASSAIEALALVFASMPTRSALQMNLNTDVSSVGEELTQADGGKSFFQHNFPSTLAVGSWTHITIALAFDARTITVTAGTNVVIDHIPMNADFMAGPAQLVIGAAYAPGPSSGATLHFDNVVFAVK